MSTPHQHGDIVPHNSRLANDNTGGMVQQDAPAQVCPWVDVHVEDLGDSRLEGQRQSLRDVNEVFVVLVREG